ncbi:AAA family ATPase [Shewanella baltica]|uniref:AAA family ATPase n=1 Tax=Shewanella baltica TaxID=62322 RepID=UPI00217E9858|nr:AAA family ATPase [Shewanella baltica]MCS6232255.1 AAA family ATPase [Shewanella baltica]
MISKKLRIGIYGVSGVGKTTLAQSLSRYESVVNCYDGSSIIAQVVAGGLDEFKQATSKQKQAHREAAITELHGLHSQHRKHTVVSGHYSFIQAGGYDIAWTQADARFYDVIFFLHKSSEDIKAQLQNDSHRHARYTETELAQWQDDEHQGLAECCSADNIRFVELDGRLPQAVLTKTMIQHISALVLQRFAAEIVAHQKPVALFDCDGTLNHCDIYDFSPEESLSARVTELFKRYESYCFDAFFDVSQYLDSHQNRQLMQTTFNAARQDLSLHPKAIDVINALKAQGTLIVFISCGFPALWQAQCELADYVIGGASFGLCGCIITNESKTQLADIINQHRLPLSAFGNGRVDLGMLLHSDQATYIFKDQANPKHLSILAGHEDLNVVKLEDILNVKNTV